MRQLFFCFLAALAALPAWAASYRGIVNHVSDGDTLWIRPDGGGRPRPLRLLGIDAPEICQAGGPQARQALATRVLHRRVTVYTQAEDHFRRPLGRLELQGQDVGQWMVQRGHAWSYRVGRDSGPYAAQERQARRRGAGLWAAAKPVEPRIFRKQHGSCG
ncbi:MAG: thermonuclease family protein [Comamonadaceae bacterium]|nr:MAG: thermonuclease family protein [Comamonadaceae bacterium]